MSRAIRVVVPAAEEEATIAACLEAVLTAADAVTVAADARVRVVVALDGCTDGTAAVVRTFPAVTSVLAGRRNVGYARRVGAAHALTDLGDDDLLASTDADSIVPTDWLVRLLELSAAADLVLGTVVPGIGLPGAVEREWYRLHDLRDGHPYVHGANLAIRAGAYRRLGGWAPLATGEDVDLADRAAAAGLRVRRTAQVPVRTSTRTIGRSPHGFATYLRELRGHVAEVPEVADAPPA